MTKSGRGKKRDVALICIATTVLACAAPEPNAHPHEIVKQRDVSYGVVKRHELRILLPEHYSETAVDQVAKAIVRTKSREKMNAVVMYFFGPGANVDGAWDVAAVTWAPHGEWGRADEVSAGDYSKFQYSTEYRDPRPAPTADRLTASGNAGFAGVPLPEGATLVERKAADPSTGSDASERYSVNATLAQIEEFYLSVLPENGWKRDDQYEGVLFFSLGDRLLMVSTPEDGGHFTLREGQ